MTSGMIDELERDIAGEDEHCAESNIVMLRVTAAREAALADLDRDAMLAYSRCRVVAHLINASFSINLKGIDTAVPIHCTNIAFKA